MAVRRVVTGEVDGRSQIVSDDRVASTPYWEDIWLTEPSDPLGRVPDPGGTELESVPGASCWRVFLVPTEDEMRRLLADVDGGDAIVEAGVYHLTNTVDLIYVLDGEITLQMDDGEVLLQPGDCVVQRRTNHAWRNRTDRPVRLLGVMTTLP